MTTEQNGDFVKYLKGMTASVLGGLAIATITGGVLMYRHQGEQQKEIDAQQKEIDTLTMRFNNFISRTDRHLEQNDRDEEEFGKRLASVERSHAAERR